MSARCAALVIAILTSAVLADVSVAGKSKKAALKRAKRTLAELKLVDGAGSGLDADTVQGLKPTVVVDSVGNLVGAVLQADPQDVGGAFVVRRIGSTPIMFHVVASGFNNGRSDVLEPIAFYESADCSGPALVWSSVDGFYPARARVAGGSTAYLPPTSAATHSVQSRSEACGPGEAPLPDGACCQTFPPYDDASLGNAVVLDLKTLGLIPPFHIDVP